MLSEKKLCKYSCITSAVVGLSNVFAHKSISSNIVNKYLWIFWDVFKYCARESFFFREGRIWSIDKIDSNDDAFEISYRFSGLKFSDGL